MRGALVLAALLLLPACSRDFAETDVFAQADLSGSVRIPLAATSSDGATYVLRNATVEISGSAMLTLSSLSPSDLSARHDALSTPLPPGSYTMFLRPGFELVEVDASGRERVIDAQLAMHNPLHFAVRELEDATLKLSFAPADKAERNVVFGAREPIRVTAVY
ncbi:MAG: hypothetical protein JWN48_3448 [Myxococcaceae bacterium]|nr:hypothetical protein [Myxococcaceae bacterium]